MNIVIYKGDFSYNTVNYFVDELSSVLRNKGHNVIIVDLSKVKVLTEVPVTPDTDLVLAYNLIGFGLANEIYNNLGIVFGGLLVDNPLYHRGRINSYNMKKAFFSVYDEGTINIAEKFIAEDKAYTHLLHAGSYSKNYISRKEYDVAVIGSVKTPSDDIDEELSIFKIDFLRDIAKSLYLLAKDNYSKTLDEHLYDVINSVHINNDLFDSAELKIILSEIYIFVDLKLRILTRYNTILNLLKSGVDIHYFGNCDSNNDLSSYPNFISYGAVSYNEALEVMAKSKISLQVLPYFKNGSHERIFSSMLNKALVICNINNFSYGMYKDKESIVYFDVNKPHDVVEKVKYYLEHDSEREAIVQRAFDITAKYNTWENRADEILEIYNVVKDF